MRDRIIEIYRRVIVGSGSGQLPSVTDLHRTMEDVRDLLRDTGHRLRPDASVDRETDDLVGTPQPLTATLFSTAGLDDSEAGEVRLLTLLLLIGAFLDALGGERLAPHASPVLIADDLGAGLHPTWLASTASMLLNLPVQLLLATHVGEMLARVPLHSIRRVVRRGGEVDVHTVGRSLRRRDDQRRVAYHVRLSKPDSLFARCWLLVEGETEAWLLPEFARLAGVDFAVEGIRCVEFAQCGIPPLTRLADDLGIRWHLLTDGDEAGQSYAQTAQSLCAKGTSPVTCLPAADIEHFLYTRGFHQAYRRAAGVRRADAPSAESLGAIRQTVRTALKKTSKPAMALAVLDAANRLGRRAVPEEIVRLVHDLATAARADLVPAPPPRPVTRAVRGKR